MAVVPQDALVLHTRALASSASNSHDREARQILCKYNSTRLDTSTTGQCRLVQDTVISSVQEDERSRME